MSDQNSSSRWPMAMVFIVFILAAAYIAYQFVPKNLLGEGGILSAFSKDEITTTFRSQLTKISDTNGGNLEVAIIKSTEEIVREASSTIRGTTESKIRFPATYRYQVPLKHDAWRIEVLESENMRACVVVAPRLQPTLPVAFDTDKLESESSEGWLRWDSEDEMKLLMSQVTPELNTRAFNNINLAKDKSRVSIAEFVRTWLLDNDQWQTDQFTSIEVRFEDEITDPNAPLLPSAPTIKLDQDAPEPAVLP